MSTEDIKPEALETLQKNSHGIVELEQSLDFLQDRTFRQTLLCHKDIVISRKVTPQTLERFYLASQARPVSKEVNIPLVSVEEFRASSGAVLKTDHPLSKAAMLCLVDVWPQYMAFPELVSAARERLGDAKLSGNKTEQDPNLEQQVLATNMFKAFGYSPVLLELHSYQPFLTSRIDDKPTASYVARIQAQFPDGPITNLRHERVTLEEFDRFILPYLDGHHDRESLVTILMDGPVASGILKLEREGAPVAGEEQRPLLVAELEYRLKWLAQASLLEEPGKLGEEVHGRRKSH